MSIAEEVEYLLARRDNSGTEEQLFTAVRKLFNSSERTLSYASVPELDPELVKSGWPDRIGGDHLGAGIGRYSSHHSAR